MLKPTKKPKVIVFDVDGTLTDRITWYQVTEKLGGSTARHADLFMRYLNDELSYNALKKKLFKVWEHNGPIHRSQLKTIFEEIHIKGEAIDVINKLQARGYKICLISGSIRMFIEILAQKFGIKYHYGNSRLIFNKDGYWVDLDYTRAESRLKVEQLHQMLEKTGLSTEDCIAIGDGKNDIGLFQEVPGVVVNGKSEHLTELAWQNAKYIPRILQILESLE